MGNGRNGVVRYDNELNQISFRGWNSLEQDIFFGVLSRMRDKGVREVVFDTDDLRDLIDFAGKSGKRWEQVLAKAAKKVIGLVYIEQTKSSIEGMTLFERFRLDIEERRLTVQVSDRFEYVINKLRANFTQFELEEFSSLRSTYAKALYRLLKQWRTVGSREFELDEFRTYLGIPKSYDSRKIRQKVLEPIMAELPAVFEGFAVEPLRSKRRGRPVVGYRFTWKPEPASSGPWREGAFDALPAKPEGRAGAAKRRARAAAERAERAERAEALTMAETERIERERRARENAEALEAERARHGGSMFIGSDGYRPAEEHPLVI